MLPPVQCSGSLSASQPIRTLLVHCVSCSENVYSLYCKALHKILWGKTNWTLKKISKQVFNITEPLIMRDYLPGMFMSYSQKHCFYPMIVKVKYKNTCAQLAICIISGKLYDLLVWCRDGQAIDVNFCS